jgi:pyruvate/2-oxoglutarate dehydrogenase complex dihydrolipoamide acyltransferase (E2) component
MTGEIIIDLLIPDLGETGEIELVSWNIQEGSTFQEGDEICELITDKAAFSLEAPEAGTLLSILITPKSKVKSGDIAGKVKTRQP